jgi:hypothetical protein
LRKQRKPNKQQMMYSERVQGIYLGCDRDPLQKLKVDRLLSEVGHLNLEPFKLRLVV